MASLQFNRQGHATVRLPFIGVPHYRSTDSSKDQRFVNCFFDPIVDPVTKHIDYFLIKRPGTSQNIRPSGASGVGRGFYVWPKTGKTYSIVGNKLYSNTTDLGVTLTTTTGQCDIVETKPSAATPYLCINDGVKLYCISTSDVVTTVTVNFPSPNTSDLIYMDTYLFTLKTDGTVWSCNADDPTTWNPANFSTVQMLNGPTVGLARQNNYLIVFQDRGMQFYWDAANAAGLPLSNVEQAMHKIGCDAQASIAHVEDSVFWVGNGYTGGYTIWKLEGASQLSEIGTSPINRILEQEGANLASATGVTFRVGGHKLYVLTLIGADRTFVWDDTVGMWVEWTDTTGTHSWPMTASGESNANKVLVQHNTNGWIYNLDTTVYQDDSTNFTVLARFGRLDFDSMDRKFCHRVEIIGDKQTSSTNVSLSYSDDDYQTFSTARTFDMSVTRPFGKAFGNFRRRAWQLTHADNTPLRLVGLELELSMAQ